MSNVAITQRTLVAMLAVLDQQRREYAHCLTTGDAEGMLRAGIGITNAAAFLYQEAIEAEAAQKRLGEVRP